MESNERIPQFTNKTIICIDCDQVFFFMVGEQGFYWKKELAEPKRCPACRKARRDGIAISKGEYNGR